MNKLTILEKLKPSSFRDVESDEIKIEGAIFMTYSIDCKSILSGLISMFADEVVEAEDRDVPNMAAKSSNGGIEKGSVKKDIVKCWGQLLRHGMASGQSNTSVQALQELQEHVAFVCNDGYDKSIASPIYWYTRELTYYYKWTEEEGKYSFHPKLYIVKYRKNEELFFRFMIGSMNFVNSKNKEFMATLDVQAYEGQISGEYVHCDVLERLLNLKDYCSPNIRNGQKTKLSEVIKNLGLDSYYFEKDVMERIITFPQSCPENAQGKQQDIILSPFLTKGMLDKLNDTTRLYTMESELKKLGYVPVEEDEDADGEKKTFYVYSVKEGEKAFTHIKMYVSDESVYVGSANFTQSALGKYEENFGKNKEILMRIDANEAFRMSLEVYLQDNYEEKMFQYEKETIAEQEINDEFRRVVEEIIHCLKQRIVAQGNGWKSELILKEDKRNNWENILAKGIQTLKKSLKQKAGIDIQIAPFCAKTETKPLSGNGPWEWQMNNRMKLDDAFLFILCIDKKHKVQLKYHIDTICEGNAGTTDTSAVTMSLTLCYLEKLLENRGVTSATITKETDQIESGILRKDTIGYVRRTMPTLETMLRKSLEKGSLSDENVQKQMQHMELIAGLIEKEESLSEEEKKLLGIDRTSKKIIENLLIQGKALLKELQEN